MMFKTGKKCNSTKLVTNRINGYLDIVHMQYILLLAEILCTYHKNIKEYIKVFLGRH